MMFKEDSAYLKIITLTKGTIIRKKYSVWREKYKAHVPN